MRQQSIYRWLSFCELVSFQSLDILLDDTGIGYIEYINSIWLRPLALTRRLPPLYRTHYWGQTTCVVRG